MLLDVFYEQWLRPAANSSAATPKWKAMQQAQIGLLRGGYAHPFHWAPFVCQVSGCKWELRWHLEEDCQ
jgi:CHAT domain-containing protein